MACRYACVGNNIHDVAKCAIGMPVSVHARMCVSVCLCVCVSVCVCVCGCVRTAPPSINIHYISFSGKVVLLDNRGAIAFLDSRF